MVVVWWWRWIRYLLLAHPVVHLLRVPVEELQVHALFVLLPAELPQLQQRLLLLSEDAQLHTHTHAELLHALLVFNIYFCLFAYFCVVSYDHFDLYLVYSSTIQYLLLWLPSWINKVSSNLVAMATK